MIETAEDYGSDFWQLFGATEQCMVDAEVALSFPEPDQSALPELITAMIELVHFWRAVGLYVYQTHYDCVLAKLLTAAGRLDEAQERVAIALQISADTGMHFQRRTTSGTRPHSHRRGFPRSGLGCGDGVDASTGRTTVRIACCDPRFPTARCPRSA